MPYIFNSRNPNRDYHIGDLKHSLCKMHHSVAFKNIDTATATPPHGRRLCSICAQMRDKHGLGKLKQHGGRKYSRALTELQEGGVNVSKLKSPWHILAALVKLKNSPIALPHSNQARIARLVLSAYQKGGALELPPSERLEKMARNDVYRAQKQLELKAKKAKKRVARGLSPEPEKKPKKSRCQKPSKAQKLVASDEFLQSFEWRKVRYAALKKSDGKCELCGRGKQHGAVLNVDHIKPRKKYPELALDVNNLQVLCGSCNHGKGNWDETDWRKSTRTDRTLDLEVPWDASINSKVCMEEQKRLDTAIPWERMEKF